MLAGMRNTVNQGFTTLIFGAIIVVFALNFGPGSVTQCSGRVPVAAYVGNRAIPEADFLKQYSYRFGMMSQFRPNYSVDDAKRENLKVTVLDEMIGNEILAQEAERRGLTVGREEIKEYIKKIQAFQTDGKFDKEKYQTYARQAYLSAAKFEEEIARGLLTEKMRKLLEDLSSVSATEVREQWENQNNRVDLEVVKVDPAFFKKDVKITDEDLKKVVASDKKALEEYFTKNAARYNEPRRVRARHILRKVSDTAPEADVQKVRAKIEEAKARLDKGEDFATVAKELSEDGSAASGGDLGLQGPGVWVKPFEDEANRLKAGETGGIIRSRFGFHIIKVEEVQEARTRKLEDVQDEVARLVLEERGLKELAKAEAQRILDAAKGGKALSVQFPAPAEGAPPGDPLAPKVESTGFFNKGSKYIPKLGLAGEIADAAFKKDGPGLLDTPLEVNGRVYVVSVREREKADPSKFEEDKGEVEERLRSMTRMSLVRDFIKQRRTEYDARKDVRVTPEVLSYEAAAPSSQDNDF